MNVLSKALLPVIFLILCILPFQSLQAQSPPVYLTGGWYFDVENCEMIKNKGILVRGGRFYELGGAPQEGGVDEYRIVHLEDDEYILPGIMDAHLITAWRPSGARSWMKLMN